MTMIKRISTAIAAGLLIAGAAVAAEGQKEPEALNWGWYGPLGHFDPVQLQRGYTVYKEVCAACHGLHLLAFRNLADPGGPMFTEAQVKALAAAVTVNDLNDKGEAATRPGTPTDRFPSPFPNEKAARAANGGALPPDLSVIVKAREHGADYLYHLLVGYAEPTVAFKATMAPGTYFNPYAPNQTIAMPPPLTDDPAQVTYAEGQPTATMQQKAKDVVAFLAWAAEPKMSERKAMGVKVIIFMLVLCVTLYFAYQHLWRDVDH
jgi:cytochrome c1